MTDAAASAKDTLLDLVRRQALLVDRFAGNIDAFNGDFSGVAKCSRLVERGADVAPVTETMIAGSFFDLVDSVLAVTEETENVSGEFMSPYVLVDNVSVTERRRIGRVRPRSIPCTAAVLCVVACTKAPHPSASGAPSGSASAASSTAAALAPLDAKSWTDPAVIERLAQDCRWQPAGKTPEEGSGRHDPMSCVLDFDQSCRPDPCHDETEEHCKPACTKACAECGEACAATCASCKAPCTDDACRRACAIRCGECRDGCVRGVDRCRTGTCNAAYQACDKALLADWRKSTCAKVCPRVLACADKCGDAADYDACISDCKKRLMTGCPERFFGYCMFKIEP